MPKPMIMGLAAGALVTFSVELLDLRLDVDDPGGSISIHAVGGVWGVLAVGLFGQKKAAGRDSFWRRRLLRAR
jgi:Amt family ammonium transporter